MKLSDLLAELREGILNDRTDRVAGTSDYLWSDARLVSYINEAQRRLAVEGLVLRDATTTECCRVTLAEGQTLYPLHPAVIAVVSAKLTTEVADLARVGHAMFSAPQPAQGQAWDLSSWTGLPDGKPLAYSTDEGLSSRDGDTLSQALLRVYPAPSAAYAGATITMQVVRKPLDELVPTGLSAVPEVPEDHHLAMLDWAAYLALRIVDDDAGAPVRAREFAASFEATLTKARQLAMRKLFAPQPWGFGRGGFSWEH